MRRLQSGLGAIAAIMILVILAALSAAIISFSTGQQMASAQDVLASRAWQVASAGTEGGLFRALKGSCDSQTWTSADDPAFKVTVDCSPLTYKDGERLNEEAVPPELTFRSLRVFRVVATACNGSAAACPDNAASAGATYVERQRVAIAYCEWNSATDKCVGP